MPFNQQSEVMALLGESFERGGLLMKEADLGENFFDVSTGLAGELLQKFCNYKQKLALIIDDLNKHSEPLQELAWEHRKHLNIQFFLNEEQGRVWLNEKSNINEDLA